MILKQEYSNKLYTSGEGRAAQLPAREEIDAAYTWDESRLYASDAEWEKHFSSLEKNYPRYKEFEGTLAQSPLRLLELLRFDEEISIALEQIYLYAMLKKDVDLGNPVYFGMYGRVTSLYSKIGAASSFIRPELMAIEPARFSEMAQSEKELERYGHFFDELFRFRQHTLSKEQEEILAGVGELAGVPYDAFSVFTNADLKFPEVTDEHGAAMQISHGRYQSALYSKDRDYRERVYRGYYTPYKDYANTITALFNGNLKAKIFVSRSRKYSSAREAALDRNSIPVRVYDNLVGAVNANLAPLHRWLKLKKRLLGVEELHPYDTYVNIFSAGEEKKYSYEEGKELVTASLNILGDNYLRLLHEAFSTRRIDVFESKGKRSGAYSTGATYGVKPYVLLNWNGLLNDVFTLAHEMGHNIHSDLTVAHQPFIYADYPIFLAEIASTFNESLLLDYLLTVINDQKEKLVLLEKYLNNAMATVYRQTMFAEFEHLVYSRAEGGEALTVDTLCALYRSTYEKYSGGVVKIDKEEEYTWARVPHFYYNFYVFQYATGFAASEALAQQVSTGGVPEAERYLALLKAGKSDYPLELLKHAGVDMTSAEPVIAVARKMNKLLDELEANIQELPQ